MVARLCRSIMTQRAIHGDYIYFVTFNVQDRRWYFVTPERAAVLGQAIQTSCEMKKLTLFGYCILPNHVHMMVMPEIMMGNAATSQRTRGRVRCEGGNDGQQHEMTMDNDSYLYTQRRRPRRRSLHEPQTFTLSDLMHSIKSTFSHALGQGKFWQHRSNFRLVTSQEDFNNKINYITYNYRKMELPETYGKSPWTNIFWKTIDAFFRDT